MRRINRVGIGIFLWLIVYLLATSNPKILEPDLTLLLLLSAIALGLMAFGEGK